MTIPQALLSHLHRADGSATYSHGGYSVIAAVNGPIEVQRRDELPEEAAIEVNIRPAAGVGGPKERHLESIIHSALRHVILTHNHPRTLIQVTLQVLSTPEDESLLRKSHSLSILPNLLQAANLALLSASVPLSMTFSAASIAILPSSGLRDNPSPKEISQASSVHVFAFSSKGDLLLSESEGTFDVNQWEAAHGRAKVLCCKIRAMDGDASMEEDGQDQNMQAFAEQTIKKEVAKARQWKDAS